MEVEFHKCFIRLAELMRQTVIKFNRADDIASAFKKTLEATMIALQLQDNINDIVDGLFEKEKNNL